MFNKFEEQNLATAKNLFNLDNYSTAPLSSQRRLNVVAHDWRNDIYPLEEVIGREVPPMIPDCGGLFDTQELVRDWHRGPGLPLHTLVTSWVKLYELEYMK